MIISRDEFLAFAEVRKNREYGLFDPRARKVARISKDKWFEIIRQHNQLHKKYKGERNGKE